MDRKRADTLEVLQQFIESQKAFLERTQSDIERLRKLKAEALANPDDFTSNLGIQLNDSAFKLSKRLEGWSDPPNLDWEFFAGHDSGSIKGLATAARTSFSQRNQPHASQRSELSDLQKLVKKAKCRIIDPVVDELTRLGCFDKDEDEEIDMEELKREIELERMMRLKKRKIRSCGGLTISISARTPTEVVIRQDVEDESGHVEISLDDDSTPCDRALQSAALDDVPQMPNAAFSASSLPRQPLVLNLPKSTRVRRASAKVQEQEDAVTEVRPLKKSKLKKEPEETPPSITATSSHRSRDGGKPKSETYKQAWSTSEQHLLERLLEEIPDGEKNRWQKISQAMNGRRTPRQVASRVQKYFEKLKRFGIGVNGS